MNYETSPNCKKAVQINKPKLKIMEKNKFAALFLLCLAVFLLYVTVPPLDYTLIHENGVFTHTQLAPKHKVRVYFKTNSGAVISCLSAISWSRTSSTCPLEDLKQIGTHNLLLKHDKNKPYYIKDLTTNKVLVDENSFVLQQIIGYIFSGILLLMSWSALRNTNMN